MIIERLHVVSFNNFAVRALKPAAIAALGCLLVSCAGTPANGTASADEECTYVRVTGSNLPVKQCSSAAEREAIAARNEEAAQNSAEDIRLLDETGAQSLGADSLGNGGF
jgi:hypothetical protein